MAISSRGGGGWNRVATAAPTSYTTSFAATENPISESGAWFKNSSNAWQNILTSGGNALAAAYSNTTGHTDDAYAYLQNWSGDNYSIVATVKWGGISAGEVELLARVADTTTQVTAYEYLYNTAGGVQFVSWDGPLDTYHVVWDGTTSAQNSPLGGDGVQIRVDCNGSNFKLFDRANSGASWRELSPVGGITDTSHTTGKPGIGIYVLTASGNISYTGFQDYQVTAL